MSDMVFPLRKLGLDDLIGSTCPKTHPEIKLSDNSSQ